MSKLDWFTILVIAICILAIGALLFNFKNIMGEKTTTTSPTELTENHVDTDSAGDYDVNIDGDGDGDNTPKTNASPSEGGERIYSPEDTETAEEAAERVAREREAELEAEARIEAERRAGRRDSKSVNTNTSPTKINSRSSSNSSEGRFLVLIGSYTQMVSAERMQRMLRQKGYRNTSIELFDNGKFARVLVGRKKTSSDAKDLQAELIADGFRDILIKQKIGAR